MYSNTQSISKLKTEKKEQVALPKSYIVDFKFGPDFAIRGLHYGTRKRGYRDDRQNIE